MTQVDAIYTIGVYGHTEQSFLDLLERNCVDIVVDVRQRRAVRGSRYAFANASRLDAALSRAGVAVVSWKDLAPSTRLRDKQKEADKSTSHTKTTRGELAPDFVAGYEREVLALQDPGELLDRLADYRRPAILCVEGSAPACHRSLAARWLAEGAGVKVVDLEVE
ncbi:MAG: DUF488 domain-containing protein [Acidimicrobiia bacterium]|nr:DUF488 domain-containing protein [Acidimicrobiia bacterium]